MGALFGFTGCPDARLADSMSRALVHRGRRGVSLQADTGATLGYRAHLDKSCCDRRGAGLYREGAQAIVLAGFLTGSRVEPVLPNLLRAYREQGPGFVRHLRGAFVLAIRDGQTIHLARDGAGARTLYYGWHDGRMLFAVEPKGILQTPGFPRRLRPASVLQYLTFSFVPGAPTMLEDLQELPPGHLLSYHGQGEPTVQRFFFFEDVACNGQRPDTYWRDQFRRRLRRAVAERVPEDEPVGVFLSGGLDSSVVTAEVARQAPRTVMTYAIHFGKGYPHELDFAQSVARRCGTQHHEVLVRPQNFLPRLGEIIWHLDDPIGDPITVPNFELSARAAQDVRWVFNGEGGDPCFGGPKNIPMLLQHWYGGIDRTRCFREKAYLSSYRRCYDDLTRLLDPGWAQQIDWEDHLENVLTPFFQVERPARFLDKLATINIRLKGGHLILPKVERMTGAWGLTPLAPLFDEEIVRFSFQMPPHLRLNGGREKVVIKQAYQEWLPPEVIARPKSGMRVPVHYWFQKEMRRYARTILSPRQVRRVGIFNPERVQQLLDYNLEEGPGRYGIRLWMLITFELWRRIVVEREPF